MNPNLIGPTIPFQSWLFTDNFTGLDFERRFYEKILNDSEKEGKK